ncbi:MAG: sulfatase [Planctomycetaceae bacterium]|nr:MAG: sulfatase [Planctomycetaceae bacterium]
MTRQRESRREIMRRTFLGRTLASLGTLAWGYLQATETTAGSRPGVITPPHHTPRARHVIHLCMAGGPSHLETFDYKPELARRHGQPMPASVTAGQPIAQLQGVKQLTILGPQFRFRRWGESGQEISELFPQLAELADELCIIRSLYTEAINHDPAHTFMNTGSTISGRPSMGSWCWYGLGSETRDLPGYIVLTSTAPGRSPQPIHSRQWHSGFLPSRYQGVRLYSQGEAVHYLTPPPGMDHERQWDTLQAVQQLDRLHQSWWEDPEVSTRISQYEMAFRLQTSVPELMDLSGETRHTWEMYGAQPGKGSFATNCLLARRLVERGVRFVQLYHRDWDHHSGLREYLPAQCPETDRACAALLRDLKQRGLLEETLVIWGGEFGRTPMAQGNKGTIGRDHHMMGFSIWLAGGGVKGGITYGATDELGYHAVVDRVSVHDLHATMLYLLGIDHTRFTYRFQGRDYRLTDVAGEVLTRILS